MIGNLNLGVVVVVISMIGMIESFSSINNKRCSLITTGNTLGILQGWLSGGG
jgi:hypothetical protein